MSVKRILFHPLFGPYVGTAHLRRCLRWASRISENKSKLGAPKVTVDFHAERIESDSQDKSHSALGDEGNQDKSHRHNLPESPWDTLGFVDSIVVFDCQGSTRRSMYPWIEWASPFLIDDDGPARDFAPFVLDTIPGPRRSKANQNSLGWLELPNKKREPDPEGTILITFGGENPEKMTIPLLNTMLGTMGIAADKISVTIPSRDYLPMIPSGVNVINKPNDLKDILDDFGLVITYYGITAWEALASGCAVLLASPTLYHQQLARAISVPEIGILMSKSTQRIKMGNLWRLKMYLSKPKFLTKAANALRKKYVSPAQDLVHFISSIEAPRARCTACRFKLPPVIFRFPTRSYYRCPVCKVIGLYRFRSKIGEYSHYYFNEEYAQKYGRTYLEDFDSIKERASGRLSFIRQHAREGARLLDIGCAFGPFLQEAREHGFRPYGSDASRGAVKYVRNNLGIPAITGYFPEHYPPVPPGTEGYGVITLWYVMEHFPDLGMSLIQINDLLAKGGVLALSTPNAAGISGRCSLRAFAENSPVDHYSIWTPKSCRRLLKIYGFRVYATRITGHHPDRFPLISRSDGLLGRFIEMMSRLLGLGDTFEIYAVKERNFE